MAAEPIPPAVVTTAGEIPLFIGLKVEGKIPRLKGPLWNALETAAREEKAHLVLADQGRTVKLEPGESKTPTSIDGAFRVVATNVVNRIDLQSGQRVCDVTLDVHWEPRLAVFRIESPPSITTATDDRKGRLTPSGTPSKSAIGGKAMHTFTVRLSNVPREAKSIATLEGTTTVTAAQKMLAFAFKDLAKLPMSETVSEVTVTLLKLAGRDAKVQLDYPAGHPEFESFESWTDFNSLKLISADRTKTWSPESFSVLGSGRKVVCDYRFAEEITAASAVYETPAPLVEFPVKFTLKDISLP